jgi:hypothetical protein
VNKLPVLRIVGASYGFVLLNLRDFLRTAWLPFIALVVMLVIHGMPEHAPETNGDQPPQLPGPDFLIALIIFLIISVTVQVAWYRRVLLGPDGLASGFPLALGRREGRFFMRMIGVLLLMLMLLLFALSVLGGILPAESPGAITMGYTALAVILLGEYYIASRLSLVLPATTVDAGTSFGHAWRLGHDNGWRIVLVLLGVQLPITLTWFAIQVPTVHTDTALQYYAVGIALNALGLLGYVLSATAMSLCFAQLGGLDGDETAGTFS